jgi:DNA-binding MarR family transcriptional regulator
VSEPASAYGTEGSAAPSKRALRLWLRLLACESIVENRIRAHLRDSFGITLPQFEVLAELEYMKRPLTMTELSKRLMVSNGNVTGVVDRLLRDGLVARLQSGDDRRVHLIKLTDQGMETFRKMAVLHETWIAEMFGDLSEQDLGALSGLLARAHDSLKSRPRGPS